MQYRSQSTTTPISDQSDRRPHIERRRRSTDWESEARFEDEDPLEDVHIAHINPPPPAVAPRLQSPKSMDNVLRKQSKHRRSHIPHSSSPKGKPSEPKPNKTILVLQSKPGRPKSRNNTPPRPIAAMLRKRSRKSSLV